MPLILCIVFAVVSLFSAVRSFVLSDGQLSFIILGLIELAFAILIIIGLVCSPPHFLCPGCNAFWFGNEYCSYCGYEFVPHCIDCGEVCQTAFCRLCGAEQ